MNRKDRRAQASPKYQTKMPARHGAQPPAEASVQFSKANALYGSKRFDEALASYDQAIALWPDFAEAYVNRGSLLKAMGRLTDALASYDVAVVLNYSHEVLFYNRGVIQLAMRKLDDALASYDKAIALKPGFAEAHNNRGTTLEELGRPEDALKSYDQAIALKPAFAEAHNNRGNVLLKIDPGNALQRMHRLRDALENYEKAVEFKPSLAEGHSNRGNVLHEMGRLEEALQSYDKAIALDPGIGQAYLRRGVTLISLGDMAGAEVMLRKALTLMPQSAHALYHLSFIRKYDAADIETMESAVQAPGLSLDDQIHLNFALGKVYDDTRNYDKAFACYRVANDLVNGTVSHDAPAMTNRINEIMAVFGGDYIRQRFAYASPSKQPLFIIGMPRTGTTLLATMLSNHDSVETAGELASFLDFTKLLPEVLGTDVPYPHVVKQMTPAVANRLTDAYLKRLSRDSSGSATYIIDKQPMNFLHLGFISMLFPDARVIHCTRDPMDTGLSNYCQMFTRHAAWSFDLKNIGHLYREYERLMEYWHETLPIKMLEVSYESVTTDTEHVMRGILDFLELDWDPRCAEPQTNTGGVQTPSSWQVRQPIYKQSVERWRHYEQHLIPLQEALAG